MPPFPVWYRGPENIGAHLAEVCPVRPGEMKLVPVEANGQPGFGTYWLRPDGTYEPFNLVVLTLSDKGITHSTAFFDHKLFGTFGLPTTG
ncbi:hypothetical protein GCM10029964_012390 [Kibdelosporangium lantanae]